MYLGVIECICYREKNLNVITWNIQSSVGPKLLLPCVIFCALFTDNCFILTLFCSVLAELLVTVYTYFIYFCLILHHIFGMVLGKEGKAK